MPQMPQLLKQCLGEAFGTFILVFIGAGAILTGTATGNATLVGVAFAHGIAIFIGVAAVGHVSGAHFNPAVTIGFLVTRRIPVPNAAAYIGTQLFAAVVAAFVLRTLFASGGDMSSLNLAAESQNLGVPFLHEDISPLAGIVIEAFLAFFLVFVIFQTAVDPKSPGFITPIAIGFTITADILIGGPLTGAAMNPARAFGPALVAGYWTDHFVYWVGPIIGGSLAALTAHHLIQRDTTPTAAATE